MRFALAGFLLLVACDHKAEATPHPAEPARSDPPPKPFPPERVTADDVPLAPSGASVVRMAWQLPAGTGINDDAPFRIRWTQSDGLASAPSPITAKGTDVQQGFDVTVTPVAGASGARLVGDLDVVVCDLVTHRVCVPVRREVEIDFRVASTEAERPKVTVPLPPARP